MGGRERRTGSSTTICLFPYNTLPFTLPHTDVPKVEKELTRHLHMSELRGVVVEHRLSDIEKARRVAQKASVQENVQLLQELQVYLLDLDVTLMPRLKPVHTAPHAHCPPVLSLCD